MGFVRVAVKEDLESSKIIGVKANGKEICLTSLDGTYYAIGNRCTHMGCTLSDGELTGENVKCICHGSIFSIKTGSVINGPAKKPEPTYQVKVEGDQIMVNV